MFAKETLSDVKEKNEDFDKTLINFSIFYWQMSNYILF